MCGFYSFMNSKKEGNTVITKEKCSVLRKVILSIYTYFSYVYIYSCVCYKNKENGKQNEVLLKK